MACKAGGRKQKFRGKHVDRVIAQLLNGELQGPGHRSSHRMPANDVYGEVRRTVYWKSKIKDTL